MGVADNKSYKDMYHFKDSYPRTREDLPSVNVDPKINSTIKNNPYRSNVEVEKDEVILKPDLSALFQVKGKTHKQGGVDVLLEDESFVFSDDKSLSFNKKEHKMMEFKDGGSFSASKNTPAEVLKRNIPLKHYNRMIANIEDPTKDDIAKNSSTKMLEKYIQTLGNIAFLQEGKKGFPDGLPAFAQSTAPIYEPQLKDQIMQQKQYAKYGGSIKAQLGKYFLDPTTSIKQNPYPDIDTPFPFHNKWYIRRNGKMIETSPPSKVDTANYILNPVNPYLKTPQQTAVDQSPIPTISLTDEEHMNPDGTNSGTGNPRISGVPSTAGRKLQGVQNIPFRQKITITPAFPTSDTTIAGDSNGIKRADWQFTPWQKENQFYNLWKWASAKRYMPYRSHLNPSFVDPTLVNPEQTIGDMKGAYNSNLQAINSLSPILRNAQASESYGQLLNQMPGVRSQYDNQNAGISNQFKQYNNQIANQARNTNMINDQNYYRETVVGQQNFDNLRSFLGDKFMTDRANDVADNQSLSYQLLTQNNPAYDFDWRTGNFTRTNKSILDAKGAPGSDMYENIIKGLDKLPDSDPKKWEIYEKILRQKNIIPYLQSQFKKKGGKVNPYK